MTIIYMINENCWQKRKIWNDEKNEHYIYIEREGSPKPKIIS